MDITQVSTVTIWNEIDLSERYMVCGMFNEASSLASSLIQQLKSSSLESIHEMDLSELMESAGMVFIQSLIELGRTPELFDELTSLYGSVEAIPVQVFITGTCVQISERLTSDLKTIFEGFLDKWRYVENSDRVFPKENQNCSKFKWQYTLDSEKYLQVVEIFTVTLLGRVLCKPDLGISWTEKANLPEEKRQNILIKLHKFNVAANSSLSTSTHVVAVQAADKIDETPSISQRFPHVIESSSCTNGHGSDLATSKALRHQSIPFWWFSNFRLKLAGAHLVLPRGRTVLLCLFITFASYFIRKRTSKINKFAKRQALFLQRALIDAWQLAFSVQVNPLAAVQQLPSALRGARGTGKPAMGGALEVALAIGLILALFFLLVLDLFFSLLCRRSIPPDLPVQLSPDVSQDAPPSPASSLGKPPSRFPFPFYGHGVLRAPTNFLLTIPKLEAMIPPEQEMPATASPYPNDAERLVYISNPIYDGAIGGEGGGTTFVTPEESPSSLATVEEEEDEEGKWSPPLALMKKLPSSLPAVCLVDGRRSLATSASVTETNRASFSSESLCTSPSW
ncbi:hypothetical protein HPP92_010804 [Vanilla planifolia]|uniref:Uncharacterized protein n=1 Tax=Vanilla planifolia TaxID=51239 RepID=A0A835QUK7_VANPL|nr:hypothetical protein HPP92_010804 [Vanilla planifolia]